PALLAGHQALLGAVDAQDERQEEGQDDPRHHHADPVDRAQAHGWGSVAGIIAPSGCADPESPLRWNMEGERRHVMGWGRWAVLVAIAGSMVAGCSHGGTTSGGAFNVAFTDERLVSAGSGCAVRGNATNTANVRAQVDLAYEAMDAGGTVIATATASFQVGGFSNFEFTSSPFSGGVSCTAISSFRRSQTHVTGA